MEQKRLYECVHTIGHSVGQAQRKTRVFLREAAYFFFVRLSFGFSLWLIIVSYSGSLLPYLPPNPTPFALVST